MRDKIKILKKINRNMTEPYGKSGFHKDNRLKRVKKMRTQDYLSEVDDEIKIGVSNIISSFSSKTIGTKVLDKKIFFSELKKAIRKHDFTLDKISGQSLVKLCNPSDYLSSGIGKRTLDPNDYVIRLHRKQVKLYLKRKFASNVDNAFAVVYSLDAYLKDPDVLLEESKEFFNNGISHVLVAILAGEGKSPLTPYRFTYNLAGGNREAQIWTAEEIRNKAREIIDFWSSETKQGWCTVAD